MTSTKTKRTDDEKMMNGVRNELMKEMETLYAEPPPYTSRPSSAQPSATNTDTSPNLSRGIPLIEDLDFKPSPLELPTSAECIAHLKLLHAFAKLRQDVGNHEGLYGINTSKLGEHMDDGVTTTRPDENLQQHGGVHEQNPAKVAAEAHTPTAQADTNAALAERLRDKRWAIFVAKAVQRFEKWLESLPRFTSGVWYYYINSRHFNSTEEKNVSKFPLEGEGFEDREPLRLPPLDVLMVWHSYMLNPRTYLEDCIRFTQHALWRTPFPWKKIYEAIDDTTFEYRPQNASTYEKDIGILWNSFEDQDLKLVKCPACEALNKVPWTEPSVRTGLGAVDSSHSVDKGFSGAAFAQACISCKFVITHEKLRVGKFIDDTELAKADRPLAGTILNMWGEPACTDTGKNISTHDPFFPFRAIVYYWPLQAGLLRKDIQTLTVDDIRERFEKLMKTKSDVLSINSGQNRPQFIAKASRIAVRKVLSHYWDNSSVFGIDLVTAVLRQGTFVQKMKKLDWIHSPSVTLTMQRSIVKYHRFIQLAGTYPKKSVVPTLDVDLAWHTHQLTPKVYYRYTMAETRKFLNHDDKIPESTLNNSFKWTSLAYEKKYGQPYSECSCWYCECTREPLRSSFLNKFSARRSSLAVNKLDTKGFTKDPHLGPHVSAHNALVLDDKQSAREKRKELEELDLQYAKVCKRYNKQKGTQAPKRDDKDAYLYGAYGYPMFYPMPVYVPYYADPSVPDHVAGGGGGACAAGTCSASASLGACAGGNGTPACRASCGGHGNVSGGCGTCGGGGGGGGDGGCGGCGGG